jgi:protein TonB
VGNGGGARPGVSGGTIAVAIAVSAALHLGMVAALSRERPPAPPPAAPVEFEVVERTPPPPPPPPEPVPEPAPAPAPKPKVVRVDRPPPPPPPSHTPPPADAPPPAKPPPVKIGLSLGSTTQGGSFAVGVGNSLHGKADERAADPREAKPYTAPVPAKYVPSTRLTTLPRKLSEPRVDYPEEAKREGIEGDVKLLLRIDENGKVVGVKVLSGPGHGLEQAAAKAAWSWRFEPGLADGKPVVTEIPLTYSFYLE